MRSKQHLLVLPVVVVAAFGSVGSVLAGAAASATVADVFRAWREREQRVSSARFTWIEEKVRANDQMQHDTTHTDENRGEPEWIIERSRVTIRIDGSKVAIDVTSVDEKNQALPRSDRLTVDGDHRVWAFREKRQSRYGSISTGDVRNTFDVLEYKPILLVYRGFDPTIGSIEPKEYRIAPSQGMIDSARAVIVEETGDHTIRQSYWLDAARDYIVLRWISKVSGRDSIRLDISYERDAEHGWIPKRWKSQFLDSAGNLSSSIQGSVIEYAINEAIDADDFRIAFPHGTHVTDYVKDKRYIAGHYTTWLRIGIPLVVLGVLLFASVWFVVRRRRMT